MNNKTLYPSLLSYFSLLAPLFCLGETAAVPCPLAHPPRLADYLPPPPTADSATAVADLGAVLEAQRLRTPEQVRRARAHNQWKDNVSPFTGNLLDALFDRERLPLARSSFNRAQENLVEVLMPAKKHFARPRPYEVTPKMKPVLPPPKGEFYPNGHTIGSYFKALLLSMLVPEHHDTLLARTEEHTQSQVLAGMRFPSDLEDGQATVAALVANPLADPAVAADFATMRKELRDALGLPELQQKKGNRAAAQTAVCYVWSNSTSISIVALAATENR